jgi:hypothetical protein
MSLPSDLDLTTFRSPSALTNADTQHQIMHFLKQVQNMHEKVQRGQTQIGPIRIGWHCGVSQDFFNRAISAAYILGYQTGGGIPGPLLSGLAQRITKYQGARQMALQKQDNGQYNGANPVNTNI